MPKTKEIANYDEAYAEYAQRFVEDEDSGGGNFVTTSGGIMTIGDDELPGNQCAVVILDSIRENTYYSEDYDPDAPAPPVCYAFGRIASDMAPHEAMQEHEHFEPQNDECEGCPMNEWGSADKGKGKACKNRRRLAIIPAGFYEAKKGSRDFDLSLFDDPDDLASSDIAFMKLPVTSVKDYSKYVKSVAAQTNKPPFAVITRIYIERDPKTQFKVRFEMIDELPDEFAATVIGRHEEAKAVIESPYAPPRDEDDE